MPRIALAQDECGAATGPTVTCTSANNPYPNGITYVAPPQDLTIVLNPDVAVDTTGSLNIGVLGLTVGNTALTINGGTGASITTGDPGAFGILAATTYGNLAVNTSSVITNGTAADGIFATSSTGTVNVNAGTTYANGAGARGISAYTNSGAIGVSGFTTVTTGANAAGFNLQSDTGNINVTLARGIFGGTVLTYGDASPGISATTGANGDISIVGNGPGGFGPSAVITNGAGSTGVLAQAAAGNVLIDLSQVQTTGAGSDAIVATSTGGGVNVNVQTATADDGRGIVATGATSATVTQSGNFIATGGDNHNAVTVLATNGPALATIGNASTNGVTSNAVDVRSPNGTATANVGAATTQGANSTGVLVNGRTGANASVSSIRTYGANADGVNATSATGIAAVTNNGSIQTAGTTSRGIYANGGGGVTISGTGSVTTAGDFAPGVYATSATGPVNVTTGDVTTTGTASTGISASSGSGAVTVHAGNLSTSGANADGVTASSDGNIAVTATSASTAGANSTGITAVSNAGTVNVDAGSVTATAAGNSGIIALGQGNVTVTSGTVDTGPAGASGIYASSFGGNVAVSSGQVTSGGPGIVAQATTGTANVDGRFIYTHADGGSGIIASSGSGNVSANAITVVTQGANAIGIDASSGTGSVTVPLAVSIFGTTVQTYGANATAVRAIGGGTVTVGNGMGDIFTQGDGAAGILATSTGGNVSVNIRQSQTQGTNADAVNVTSQTGMASATVQAAATNGDGSRALVVTGATGATATQNGFFVATGGNNAGAVVVQTTNGTALANIGNASTNGAYSRAVDVQSTNGNAIANVGAATTQGAYSTAVRVRGATGASATTSSVRTYGIYSDGINVVASNGPVTITNNGSVRTSGFDSYGIFAAGNGAVAVSGSGTVATTGNAGIGIYATSSGGPVTVSTGAVTTTGATAAGIVALANAGTATVTSGAVSTTGADAIAIGARGISASVTANGTVTRTGALGPLSPAAAIGVQGTNGSASANVGTVTASGTGLSAVLAAATTTAGVTVRTGGVITGNVDGINITSGTGSTIANGGTINTGTGYAIRATGGPAAIANSGTINGRVLLSAANDSLVNSGIFNATQSSDFGAGTDSFTNSGTVFVLPGATTAATIAFTGLESFANSGTVDLRNGHTGDVFNLGNAAFTGSGSSTLGLDVQLGGATPTADRLVAGPTTGSTRIVLNNMTTGVPLLNPGVIVVQGGAGSNAGAFTLANGSMTYGFVTYGLAFNATTNAFSLVGAPSASAYRTLKLAEGARNLWYKSADAWSGHMADLRDAAWRSDAASTPSSHLWMQMYGAADQRRNATQSFSAFGTVGSADLRYLQDDFGGQIGYDFGSAKPSGGLTFGVTGGYLNSSLNFYGTADRVTYNAANVGIYAAYVAGGLFMNALGKYDHYWLDTHLGGLGNERHLNGNGYGGQAEVGFRFGGKTGFFAEPVASIAYVRTDLDSLNVPGFSFGFDDRNGVRGKAGLRVGSTMEIAGTPAQVYASGMAVHEFQGRDRVDLASGGQSLTFVNDRIGTYGQGTVGISIGSPNGVSGFLEGYADYGEDYRGGGGRGGLRVRF
jgi:hypothetical protein